MQKRLLVFHSSLAPYRIEFFNSLNSSFETRICFTLANVESQNFNTEWLKRQLRFEPFFLLDRYHIGIGKIPKGIVSQLKEWNPNIVFVPEFGIVTIVVILYRLVTRKKFKIVSICDDSYNMITEDNDFKLTHKLARKLVVPFLDELILVEPSTVEWYRRNYGKGFWFPIIIPDKKAELMYERLMERSLQEKAHYKLEHKNVFLFVGRLVKLKNVKTAIDAFSLLNQEENVLVIIGDGVERTNLEAQAKRAGVNVLFLGHLEGDELSLWYNIADVFVLPSYQEAFGAVTNEALLAGCWGIISNMAGSRCLIQEGKNGYNFDPLNADELADKMRASIMAVKQCSGSSRRNRMYLSYEECMSNLINHLNQW